MRKASAIELDEAQRERLVKLAQSNTTEVRLAALEGPSFDRHIRRALK